MKSHGINGKILEWIEAWLTACHGCKSIWKNVISGVPQGSFLVSLLLIIFVNTINDGVASRVLKFVDDIKVFRVSNGARDQDAFQSDLDKLLQWSERWQIESNFTKCMALHTGRIKNRREYPVNGYKL